MNGLTGLDCCRWHVAPSSLIILLVILKPAVLFCQLLVAIFHATSLHLNYAIFIIVVPGRRLLLLSIDQYYIYNLIILIQRPAEPKMVPILDGKL